jgi:hypothetical protein
MFNRSRIHVFPCIECAPSTWLQAAEHKRHTVRAQEISHLKKFGTFPHAMNMGGSQNCRPTNGGVTPHDLRWKCISAGRPPSVALLGRHAPRPIRPRKPERVWPGLWVNASGRSLGRRRNGRRHRQGRWLVRQGAPRAAPKGRSIRTRPTRDQQPGGHKQRQGVAMCKHELSATVRWRPIPEGQTDASLNHRSCRLQKLVA